MNTAHSTFSSKYTILTPNRPLSDPSQHLVYVFIAKPTIPAGLQFVLLLLNFFGVYGISMIISFLVPRQDAPLLAVVIGLFVGVFCGYGPQLNSTNQILFDLSPNRWAAEAQMSLWIRWYEDVYELKTTTSSYGYEYLTNVTTNLIAMVALGVGYRIIGFALLVLLQRDKQR
ncbi:hypothetical protein DFJ73DRAFT_836448 [Zopfochytrium polystomum]|nr:hypothetical protein DFJ73DRAFT_836448 [Zopfochytrium polystomum]